MTQTYRQIYKWHVSSSLYKHICTLITIWVYMYMVYTLIIMQIFAHVGFSNWLCDNLIRELADCLTKKQCCRLLVDLRHIYISRCMSNIKHCRNFCCAKLTWQQQFTCTVDQIIHNWLECIKCQSLQLVALHIDVEERGCATQ